DHCLEIVDLFILKYLLFIGKSEVKYVFIFIFIYERQSVGGYGIPAIPSLTLLYSLFSGYGKDAIPSY
uniref:hypothetical protein n=1 Tax=Prevotella sp. TaxID=59823 RepID=UPI003AF8B1FB